MFAALITLIELHSAECRVACQYSGFDTGRFEDEKCLCIDFRDYAEITNRKIIKLPRRKGKPSQNYVISNDYRDGRE